MSDEGGTAAGEREGDRPRAVVVGPGRIGLTLAEALQSAAVHDAVQVTGRSREAPAFLAGRPGISYLPADDWRPPSGSGFLEVFFAVPDAALEPAAREWARRLEGAGAAPARAFHTSGAHPPEALAPLGELGAAVGVLHPLRSVPEPRPGALSGAWFGVAGREGGRRRARELAASLGGRTLEIRAGASGRYHAAAVLASNLLAGCLLLARREMVAASDDSPRSVRAALDDLARSALEAVEGEEGGEGITGPLARGDLETVGRHLAALDSTAREAYAALTRVLAREGPSLEPDVRARLEELTARVDARADAGASDATNVEEGGD